MFFYDADGHMEEEVRRGNMNQGGKKGERNHVDENTEHTDEQHTHT